ncbi:putative oligoribonuclease [Hypsizygus marmoreus]|uniref:Oligoribonuclease n=1 Tax=Hypsizygus marmoreus TaxID=39966 RepID=A0A369JSS8_HYPMA|nr:putative oligoribonuclease [Hypsizygus marmoreus]
MLRAPGILRHCQRLPFSAFLPKNQLTRTKRYMAKPLDFYDGPLVWVDCEMTGLNPRTDKILEIAVLITNGNLDIVDDGIQFVIRTDKKVLDGMGEWCKNQHAQSGLINACLTSPHSHKYVSKTVLAYIKKWIPYQRVGVLAGNSVHADRSFLVESMPEVVDWLHYRIVDVSSIKELSRRWYPSLGNAQLPESNHRALDDIRGSIKELQWYRDTIFKPPPPLPSPLGQPAKESSEPNAS